MSVLHRCRKATRRFDDLASNQRDDCFVIGFCAKMVVAMGHGMKRELFLCIGQTAEPPALHFQPEGPALRAKECVVGPTTSNAEPFQASASDDGSTLAEWQMAEAPSPPDHVTDRFGQGAASPKFKRGLWLASASSLMVRKFKLPAHLQFADDSRRSRSCGRGDQRCPGVGQFA